MHAPNIAWRPGSARTRAGGAYSAPPDPLAELKGPTSKGRGGGGVEREGKGGRGGREGGGKRMGGLGAYEP